MSDLISRNALREKVNTLFCPGSYKSMMLDCIDNAPTIKTYCYFCGQTEHGKVEEKPQGKFVEMLKDRIEESICKCCPMNKHCELCEISRVFSIIDLTDKEMKEGAE